MRSPDRSARRQGTALQLADCSVRQILHLDLRFHPYKLTIVRQLNEGDYAQRTTFAEIMLNILADKAFFHLKMEEHKNEVHYLNRSRFVGLKTIPGTRSIHCVVPINRRITIKTHSSSSEVPKEVLLQHMACTDCRRSGMQL